MSVLFAHLVDETFASNCRSQPPPRAN